MKEAVCFYETPIPHSVSLIGSGHTEISNPEDGGSAFLRQPNYTVS